jgi:hypothetical protein
MQIDERDEHLENANLSTDDSLEPDSNMTVERDSDSAKEKAPSSSIEEGTLIDETDAQCEKADWSIDERFEPDSNVTAERLRHGQKHRAPSLTTDDGMQIDESDEQGAKAHGPIHDGLKPDSNVTAEKETGIARNTPRQAFRQRKECKSMKEMNIRRMQFAEWTKGWNRIRR